MWIICRDLGFKFNLILLFQEIICYKPVTAHPDTEFCTTCGGFFFNYG